MVTKTRFRENLGIYYRLASENFWQENRKFYFEFKLNPNSGYSRLPLSSLSNIFPRSLMYWEKGEITNEQGEALFSNSLPIGLVERNDSLLFITNEMEMLNIFYIAPDFTNIKFIGNEEGEISNVPADSTTNSAANQNRKIKVLKFFEEEDTIAIILNDLII